MSSKREARAKDPTPPSALGLDHLPRVPFLTRPLRSFLRSRLHPFSPNKLFALSRAEAVKPPGQARWRWLLLRLADGGEELSEEFVQLRGKAGRDGGKLAGRELAKETCQI
jgi:hypothetical protein